MESTSRPCESAAITEMREDTGTPLTILCQSSPLPLWHRSSVAGATSQVLTPSPHLGRRPATPLPLLLQP